VISTVVGSYPKIPDPPAPARLRTALTRIDRNEVALEELVRIEDDVTREVIREQEEAGIDLVTDGHIRWSDEVTYVASQFEGISLGALTRFFDTNTYYRRPVVEERLAWRAPITTRDLVVAAKQSHRPLKAVLPGPYTLARLSQDRYYGSLERLTLAFADALNSEAKALQELAPALVQFNEPAITQHPEDVTLAGEAWWRLLSGLTVETAVYFYFGPPGDAHAQAVEAGFTTIGVDATIEGIMERLESCPRPGKLAVGVVDSRTTRLESRQVVEERIRHALRIVAPEDLYVNPNMGLEFLPRHWARAKLKLIVEAISRLNGVKCE